MIACAYCVVASPISIAAAGVLGGWAAFFVILRPCRLTNRMSAVWGIPRMRVSDFVSLGLLFLWPLAFAGIGRRDHCPAWIATCAGIFAATLGYVWFRGLWILQQLGIHSFGRRTLLLAVLLPATAAFSFIVGHWLFAWAVFATFPSSGFMIEETVIHGAAAGMVYVGTCAGMDRVFGRRSREKQPIAT